MSWRTTRASAQTGEPARNTAVIDLGSNSWRLVVFSYGGATEADSATSPGAHGASARAAAGGSAEGAAPRIWWKRTDELYESVRIAEGMGESGALQEPAVARGLETLAVFERFCRASRLAGDDVHAIATSAIRDATNRAEFLARARAVASFPIEVLSAEAEAHYGYLAAVNTSTLTDGVVLDIGGGSLQLVEVAGRRQQSVISFPLGAVRMTERFLPGSGPARKKDLQKLRAHIREAVCAVPWLAERHGRLVGTGGAVRNLAAAAGHAALGPSGGIDIGVQGYVVTRRALSELVEQLASLPAAERAGVQGVKPGRADIILAAAVTLETVLGCGEFNGIETTEAGLRDCSARTSRCSETCARPPSGTLPCNTNRTSGTPSTWPGSRCRCTNRSPPATCSARSRASGSCCGRPECSTTSA
jgi:exopolyphosphatase/pppGpp-phosphohydrolase